MRLYFLLDGYEHANLKYSFIVNLAFQIYVWTLCKKPLLCGVDILDIFRPGDIYRDIRTSKITSRCADLEC